MERSWLGTSLDELHERKGPYSFAVSPVMPSKHHAVLYELPVDLKATPRPHRNLENRHWDDDHVKVPYSPKNCFLTRNESGEELLRSRWRTVKEVYSKPINSSYELEAAIKSYQPHLPKLEALHYFFNEIVSEEESEAFFKTMLPGIVQLALKLPEILPGNLPLLKKETNRSVSLSQLQIASLTANAFLCTFPERRETCPLCPGFNFQSLFAANKRTKRIYCVSEKLKCIFHYFRRVLSQVPCGVVTFERRYLRRNQVPRWDRVENNLGDTKVHVCSSGTIEDGAGYLQVDFANKFVGGGVLGYGCVQEEIRYMICPELIVSRLFTEELGITEALIVTGVERYSKYSGYGDTFTWNGDYIDVTPHDLYGRRRTTVVAIDAIKFDRPYDQFNSSLILREINKAFVGFHSHCDNNLAPVSTGNWGCGAFKGDPKLKFLVQLMACSVARRNMVYYTFGDAELRDAIHQLHLFLSSNALKVFELWRLLCRFSAAHEKQQNFVAFLKRAHSGAKAQTSIRQFFTPMFKKSRDGEIRAAAAEKSAEGSRAEQMEIDLTDMFGDEAENGQRANSGSDDDVVNASPIENKEPVYKKLRN